MVPDHGLHLTTRCAGFVLQPADQVDDRNAIRAPVEVVAQKGQSGLPPTPSTVGVEHIRLPKRRDQELNVPVHIADYVVHLPNLKTARTIRGRTRGMLRSLAADLEVLEQVCRGAGERRIEQLVSDTVAT